MIKKFLEFVYDNMAMLWFIMAIVFFFFVIMNEHKAHKKSLGVESLYMGVIDGDKPSYDMTLVFIDTNNKTNHLHILFEITP